MKTYIEGCSAKVKICEDQCPRYLDGCSPSCFKPLTTDQAPRAEVTCSGGLATIVDAVPTNWCDPLLTGDNKVIGEPPYNCKDIERLLNGIRERIQSRMGG